MEQLIPIKQILGQVTNADMEDTNEEYATLLQNYLPRNGKLIKTHGFGDYFASAVGATKTLGFKPLWIGAYINKNLTTTLGSGRGYAIIAYGVNAMSNIVQIKYWTGTAWAAIDGILANTLGTYYHKCAKNPVIQANNIMRFLPGNFICGEFKFRISMNIPATDATVTNYVGMVDLTFQAGMQPDQRDVRFVDTDGVTMLAQFRESYTSSSTARWWFKVPSKPLAGLTIFAYYGSETVQLESNGGAVFPFYDDGQGETLDKWTVSAGGAGTGYARKEGGEIVLQAKATPGSDIFYQIKSITSIMYNNGMRIKLRQTGKTTPDEVMFGLSDSGNLIIYLWDSTGANYYDGTLAKQAAPTMTADVDEIHDIHRDSTTTIRHYKNGTLTLTSSTTFVYPLNPVIYLLNHGTGYLHIGYVFTYPLYGGVVQTVTLGTPSTLSAVNEPKGIWMGWIEGDRHDGLTIGGTAAEVSAHTADYEEGFYALPIEIVKPDVSTLGLNPRIVESGMYADGSYKDGDIRFYRFSYTYDGNQESQLSEHYRYEVTADDHYLMMTLSFDRMLVNKRITHINIYRCETQWGTYKNIHTIEINRPAAKIKKGASGAYTGNRTIYIPSLSNFDFDLAVTYQLKIMTWAKEDIVNPGNGTGFDVFHGVTVDGPWHLETIWGADRDWELYDKGTGVKVAEGTGCWGGQDGWIINEDLGYENYYDGWLNIPTLGYNYKVDQNYGKAIKIDLKSPSVYFTDYQDLAWFLPRVIDGVYFAQITGELITYTFYDNKLVDGLSHPFQNAVSLKMIGQYAIPFKGRLFLANITLDPGGKNEVHEDWYGYSEPDMFDVMDVANVKALPDREGGPILGMAVSFNSLIFAKSHAYFKTDIDDPADDASWNTLESALDRGNIAIDGLTQVGHRFFPVSHDGIYMLDVNMVAASDLTPMIQSRITEAVNDKFLLLDDINGKAMVISGYDQINKELIFRFSETVIMAYNLPEGKWRKISTARDIACFGYDQNANLVVYDNHTDMIYCLFEKEAVNAVLQTKRFRISHDRHEIVRRVKVVYLSDVVLNVNVHLAGLFFAKTACGTLASTAGAVNTVWVPIKQRSKSFILEIEDASANDDAIEIHDLQLVVDTA